MPTWLLSRQRRVGRFKIDYIIFLLGSFVKIMFVVISDIYLDNVEQHVLCFTISDFFNVLWGALVLNLSYEVTRS